MRSDGHRRCRHRLIAISRPFKKRGGSRSGPNRRLPVLAELTQDQIDRIVDAMAAATRPRAEEFARLAVEETGYGVVADKIQKNLFSSERVYEFIRPMKTVGVVGRDDTRKIVEIAEPFGVVAAIVPSTNPTSTAIYKILIALKARCPIVISPHPSAARCITRVAEVMADGGGQGRRPGRGDQLDADRDARRHAGIDEAPRRRGDPRDRRHGPRARRLQRRQTRLRRRPRQRAVFHRTHAPTWRRPPATSSSASAFDNGVLCSSPNSVVVENAVADEAKREFVKQGGYFLSPAEADKLAAMLVTPQRLPNPKLVGKSAHAGRRAGWAHRSHRRRARSSPS